MFGLGHGPRILEPSNYPLIIAATATLLAVHGFMRGRTVEAVVDRTPWLVRSIALAVMIVAIILMQGQDRAFIYFQF
jgi:hypothetical protein